MSPRRRLRANREKWRADQTGRNIRLKIATHLAAVLVTHGNCAKPETGWSEAERLFTKADSAESAARASAPALLFCEECPVVRECRRWAAVDRPVACSPTGSIAESCVPGPLGSGSPCPSGWRGWLRSAGSTCGRWSTSASCSNCEPACSPRPRPLQEEPGWRAFALPRMQASMRPLAADAGLGVVHTLWHAPLFLTQEWDTARSDVGQLAAYLLLVVALSIVLSWVFNTSEGSSPQRYSPTTLSTGDCCSLETCSAIRSTTRGPQP